MKSYEVNFDGQVGPTHNYGGLSYGNVASQSNSQQSSNPKEAALQGLAKMKALMDMGFVQGVLAPQERPDVAALRRLGFAGSDAQVIQQAARQAMPLLVASCSASSMWVANAATVSPDTDVTFSHMRTGLQVSTAPSVTNRPKPCEQIATSQAVNHHH